MSDQTPKFKKGDTVRLRSRTADWGVIIDEPRSLAGTYSYRVNFGGSIRNYGEDDLEACNASEDIRELFLDGSFGDRESCRLYLTYLRVSGGLSNYIYSFNNSKTQFFTHQFKPLLKFLDAAQGRVLLADEVGLGKTIEAGLILIELDARDEMNRALVVCPAKLRLKWRRELLDRFNYDFPIMGQRTFLAKLRELEKNQYTSFTGILSYESARSRKVIEALDESGAKVDVVIADEAHLMRNRNTLTSRAGSRLAELSDNLLLLTATPINNRSEDIFNLLSMLDGNLFARFEEFELLRLTNRVIVRLEQLLRAGLPLNCEIAMGIFKALEKSEHHNYFKGNYIYEKLKDRIIHNNIQNTADLVGAQRLVSKINLLNRNVVRTRRRDVDEKRPIREPHLYRTPMTSEEEVIYHAVYEMAMRYYSEFRLPVINIERILSSSIPAFVRHYLDMYMSEAEDTDYEDNDDNEEIDEDGKSTDEEPKQFLHQLPELRNLLEMQGADLLQKKIDSKFDALIEILKNLDQDDPGCKIIIFTYFRKTIIYLCKRLRNAGYDNVCIHGGVPTSPDDPDRDEREIRRQQFADPDGMRILLSSEVGSEGLDFQFSHVIVNYDLPWNPMRVEQRIGRIDRIGQQKDRLLIYSLTLAETIDESIYDKLMIKIGIFKDTLGDIESILGTEIQQIQNAVFDSTLTEEEKREQIEQAAEVIERRQIEIEELERDRSKIIGTDQYILEEIERIQSSKRFVGPDEIRDFLHSIFEGPEIGFNIQQDNERIFSSRIPDSARRYFHTRMEQSVEANQFRSALSRETLHWTFDFETAAVNPKLILFNQRHPVVRAICSDLEKREGSLARTFQIAVHQKNIDVAPSVYVLALYGVEYEGHYKRKHLEAFVWCLDTDSSVSANLAGALLSTVISSSKDIEHYLHVPREQLEKAVDKIETERHERLETRRRELEGEESVLLKQRREQINFRAEREKARALAAIETLKARKNQTKQIETLIKANKARVEKIEGSRHQRLAELPEKPIVHVSWNLKSLGLIKVD